MTNDHQTIITARRCFVCERRDPPRLVPAPDHFPMPGEEPRLLCRQCAGDYAEIHADLLNLEHGLGHRRPAYTGPR